MSALAAVAHQVALGWRALGMVLLQGTALALLAWLLAATLLRRARPALLAALWSVVLLKFALPVGPAMPFSLSDALARLFGGGAEVAAAPVPPDAPAAVAHAPVMTATAWLALIGAVLWLAGVAFVIARGVRHARRARALARALPTADGVTDAIACGVAERLGLARTPELRVGGTAAAPWLVGLRRPIVVVPAALAHPLRRAELTAALTHELAHLRRRDVWLRLFQIAVGALFFFWPAVRWVNRRVDAAREMACDAWAVAEGPLPAADYARMLVRLVRDRAPAPAAALGLAATPGLLRGRVDSVMRARGRGPGLGKLGAALLGVWTAVALGGARTTAAATAEGAKVCRFSQAMADALYQAHPEADLDGDGVVTREEACEFEAAHQTAEPAPMTSGLVIDGGLDPSQLCCNCTEHGSTPPALETETANTCVRGVTP